MSRAMENFKSMPADLDMIALVEPAVWLDVAGARDPVDFSLRFETLKQHAIGAVGTFDFDIQFGAQIVRAAGVIDVAVGQQNFLNPCARLGNCALDDIEIPAWIDNGASLAHLIPNDRAILLERCHLNGRDLERG